jgi:uncharacterized protein YciI
MINVVTLIFIIKRGLNMFAVSISYTVELSEVDPHIEAHIAYLEKYYAAGNFIASGRKVPRTSGVILAQAESKTALEKYYRKTRLRKRILLAMK